MSRNCQCNVAIYHNVRMSYKANNLQYERKIIAVIMTVSHSVTYILWKRDVDSPQYFYVCSEL